MGAWRSRNVGLALVAALAVAACARGAPSTGSSPSARPATSASPVATSAAGDGPLVVDTDLGADDIVAIALLVASDADIRAVTVAGTGLVHCAFGVGHLEMLLHRLGAPDIPVGCGRETAEPPAVPMPGPWRSAADNAYGLTLAPTRPARTEPAPAAIASAIRSALAPVTILELGPWTNLGDAFRDDPSLTSRVERIHAMGGTIDHPGNAYRDGAPWDAPVEANFAADPIAVERVLATGVPVSLVPLDATDRVPVPADIPERLLAARRSAAVVIALELFARNPFLADAGQFLWDETATMALVEPGIGAWEELRVALAVEPATPGRLARAANGRPVRALLSLDGAAAATHVVERLASGPAAVHPYEIAGSVRVTETDAECAVDPVRTRAGQTLVRFVNGASTPASVLLARATPPRTIDDLVGLAGGFRPGVDAVPSWVSIVTTVSAAAHAEAFTVAALAAGAALPICGVEGSSRPRLLVGDPILASE
jgi:pyrimidine-specific ribonucleoside hydrolase